MTTAKYLGIWMDHANAHLMEFNTEAIETKSVHSKFTHQAKEHSLSRGEKIMHNKEQHEESQYYKNLGEVIRDYEGVVLFGPTHAKEELFNLLKDNHLFSKIKIEVKHCENLNENQQHAFVKDYFKKYLHQ